METQLAENSVVKTDAERWSVDTYALWAEHMGGSRQCIGGYQKTEDNSEMLLNILERDWEITNPRNGIETVNLLIGKENHHDPTTDAWDYCRATQLLGMFYLVGFLDRKTLSEFNYTVGKILQEQFHSWKELCESYLRGCETWYRKNFDRAQADEMVKERRQLYKKFCKQKDGPYRQPWKLSLEVTASENEGGYYERWQKNEEAWVKTYHMHVYKQFWLIIAPCIFFGLALIMGLVALADSSMNPFAMAISGALISLPVLIIAQIVLFITTRKGRLRRAIRRAQRSIELDESEKEMLGMELLDALAGKCSCLEYRDKPPQGLKSPAKVLVSEHFFYQINPRPVITLIRRSDIDYLEWGTERTRTYGKHHTTSTTLYAIYFYLRSGRERRLEGATTWDNGMGFFDKTARDKAFFMMDGKVQQ